MTDSPFYPINPRRDVPWNALPDLPLAPELWRTPDVLEQLGLAQEALGRLHGRSIAIPNQGLLINTISLQEAKASSAIENIFTTDDELYRALSATAAELQVLEKQTIQGQYYYLNRELYAILAD